MSTIQQSLPSETDRDTWLKQRTLEYLYGNAATAAFGSLAVVLVLAFGIHGYAPDYLVYPWGAVAIIIAAVRFVMLSLYRKTPQPYSMDTMRLWYRLMSLVSGIFVGLGCWLFIPLIPPEFQVMFIASVLGINGGAIATYAADHMTFKLFMYPSCISATATVFWYGTDAFMLMGVLFLFFMVVMTKASAQAAGTFLENIALSYSLHYRATHDSLTGLLNREEFENHYELHVSQTRHGLALIFIDLDNFKQLNDKHGHKAGDDALVQMARIIRRAIRKDDCAARLGGDEFVVLLLLDDVAVAEKAAESIRRQVRQLDIESVPQNDHALGCSIGIAFSSNNSVTYKTMMNRADQACYASKARGKNQFTLDRVN